MVWVSLAYTPYPTYLHLAAYVAIALPKGTFWWSTVLTLWYHHINISLLCHNATLVCLSLTNTPKLQYNVMVPLHHSILVTPWYPGILLWYGSFSHIRHILPHIAPYVPTVLHKARYGPTALTLCTIISLHFPLCYNGTLLWLSLTNTPMHVISLSSIMCILPASSPIHPYVSRIFP